MDNDKLFGPTIDLAAKALDLRTRKHQLMLSNIANADTPGYKAFDLMVDEALAKQSNPEGHFQLKCTDSAHLGSGAFQSTSPTPQVVRLSTQVTLRGDGNTVNMDREMTNLAANQLLYKASTQIVSSKFKGLRDVIQGGGR